MKTMSGLPLKIILEQFEGKEWRSVSYLVDKLSSEVPDAMAVRNGFDWFTQYRRRGAKKELPEDPCELNDLMIKFRRAAVRKALLRVQAQGYIENDGGWGVHRCYRLTNGSH
jgi:hypothetical protein